MKKNELPLIALDYKTTNLELNNDKLIVLEDSLPKEKTNLYFNYVKPSDWSFNTPTPLEKWYEPYEDEITQLWNEYNELDEKNIDSINNLLQKMKNIYDIHLNNIRKSFMYSVNLNLQFSEEIYVLKRLLIINERPEYLIKSNNINMYESRIDYNKFKKLLLLWNDTKILSFDDFIDGCNLCSEWYRDDGTNMKKLYDLPYSHTFKQKIAKFCCNYLFDTPEEIEDICIWMDNKIKILNNNTLEKKCLIEMILNNDVDNIPEYIKDKHDYIKYVKFSYLEYLNINKLPDNIYNYLNNLQR